MKVLCYYMYFIGFVGEGLESWNYDFIYLVDWFFVNIFGFGIVFLFYLVLKWLKVVICIEVLLVLNN